MAELKFNQPESGGQTEKDRQSERCSNPNIKKKEHEKLEKAERPKAERRRKDEYVCTNLEFQGLFYDGV